MSDFDSLTVETTDGIATVSFDDPDSRNAIDLSVADELVTAATTLGDDPDVRCIVLTHTSQFFCTGADLTTLAGDGSDTPTIRHIAGRLHEAIVQFHQTETPVVGGIDGVAAGAGFALALCPDLLVLSDEARLDFAYQRIGLTGDGGSTFFLPRLIGLLAAKELVLLDEAVTPERALDLGLANEVVATEEFDDRLSEVAADIAEGPTAALGKTMRLLTESYDRSLEEQLSAETDAIAGATKSTDYERGFAAFFGDEDAAFTGR
jgi:2-(1,2-epoxy-1,2-dihydrophenyl)acetyl-CoA isomerase